jgi:hypothetical protein
MAISAELSTVLWLKHPLRNSSAPSNSHRKKTSVRIDQMYKPDRAINHEYEWLREEARLDQTPDAGCDGDAPSEKDLNRVAGFLNSQVADSSLFARVLPCALRGPVRSKLIRMNAFG